MHGENGYSNREKLDTFANADKRKRDSTEMINSLRVRHFFLSIEFLIGVTSLIRSSSKASCVTLYIVSAKRGKVHDVNMSWVCD